MGWGHCPPPHPPRPRAGPGQGGPLGWAEPSHVCGHGCAWRVGERVRGLMGGGGMRRCRGSGRSVLQRACSLRARAGMSPPPRCARAGHRPPPSPPPPSPAPPQVPGLEGRGGQGGGGGERKSCVCARGPFKGSARKGARPPAPPGPAPAPQRTGPGGARSGGGGSGKAGAGHGAVPPAAAAAAAASSSSSSGTGVAAAGAGHVARRFRRLQPGPYLPGAEGGRDPRRFLRLLGSAAPSDRTGGEVSVSAEGVGGSPVGGRSGVLRVGGTGEGPPECVWGGGPTGGGKSPRVALATVGGGAGGGLGAGRGTSRGVWVLGGGGSLVGESGPRALGKGDIYWKIAPRVFSPCSWLCSAPLYWRGSHPDLGVFPLTLIPWVPSTHCAAPPPPLPQHRTPVILGTRAGTRRDSTGGHGSWRPPPREVGTIPTRGIPPRHHRR